MKFKWEKKTQQFQNGEILYIKNLKVGEYSWEVLYKEDNNLPYKIYTTFPFKLITNRFKTIKEAKIYLETKIKQALIYLYEN